MDSDSLAYNSDNWLEISKVTILPFSPIFGAQNVLEFSQNYSYVCLPRLSRYMLLLELLASLCLLLDQDWNLKNCSDSRNWISNEIRIEFMFPKSSCSLARKKFKYIQNKYIFQILIIHLSNIIFVPLQTWNEFKTSRLRSDAFEVYNQIGQF